MELIDLMSAKRWVTLEKEIHKRSGLNAAVFDKEGGRVTTFVEWANELCARIKGDLKGQRFICGVANRSLIAKAHRTGKAVVSECDAGLTKFVVPVFVGNEFLGVVGGCGHLSQEEGATPPIVDPWLINKVTGISEPEVEQLAGTVTQTGRDEIWSTVNYVKGMVRCIVKIFGLYKEELMSVLNDTQLRHG